MTRIISVDTAEQAFDVLRNEGKRTSIPIPARMSHLKVDPRGYAIPYGVVIDRDGTVHFAINDERVRISSIESNLCSLCGKPLLRGRWFVGGPLAAFHPYGAFIDPPMHYECSHYALQVCPYLAAPRYVKEIGKTKAEAADFGGGMAIMLDNTMQPGRPRDDLFIAINAIAQEMLETGNVKPKHPYVTIEYWKHGKLIERLTGSALKKRIDVERLRALEEKPIPEDVAI